MFSKLKAIVEECISLEKEKEYLKTVFEKELTEVFLKYAKFKVGDLVRFKNSCFDSVGRIRSIHLSWSGDLDSFYSNVNLIANRDIESMQHLLSVPWVFSYMVGKLKKDGSIHAIHNIHFLTICEQYLFAVEENVKE